jgi:hypothetical protein
MSRRTPVLSLLLLVGFTGTAAFAATEPSHDATDTATPAAQPREYRSRNFLVHTDLDEGEAAALLEKLETMLRIITRYWGAPMRKTINCYVVDDLSRWSSNTLPAEARAVVQRGGVTMARGSQRGNRLNLNATVFASSKYGTPQHEAVHAYCYQTFGRTGPTWYAEGMAEIGNYWVDGDATVNAPAYVISYLKSEGRKTCDQITDDQWGTGDGWRNYAWRWALCHFLVNNPNYSERFRVLGISFLSGRPASFERTYAAKMNELEFEFKFFVDHLQQGFHVGHCAWDWTARYRTPDRGRVIPSQIRADRGWQPGRVRVVEGTRYRYTVDGAWSTGADETLNADGRADGRGRLAGVILDDYELSDEILLGTDGTFTALRSGQLLLRCRDAWNSLEDNSGKVSVEISVEPAD